MLCKTPRAVILGLVVLAGLVARHGLLAQPATNQILAEEIEAAVRNNPNQAQETVVRAIRNLTSNGQLEGAERQKAVAAIVGAAAASLPRDRAAEVLNAALVVEPGMATTIAQTALTIFPTGMRSQAAGAIPLPGMVSGVVKVLRVEGGDAVAVDPEGKRAPLHIGAFLPQGSSLATGPATTVDLLFENGTTIQVDPSTELSLDRLMTSPFDSDSIDYQGLREEPAPSNTLIGVPKGTILFDVAKLKKNSSLQIVTPLGIAGIRGTAGFVRSEATGSTAPVAFGLLSGSARFNTPNGNARSVGPGESLGVSGLQQGCQMESNPANSANLLVRSENIGSDIRSSVGPAPFRNAPPRSAPDAQSPLTLSQIEALVQAALESEQALVQTALLLAMESPAMAPAIAAFAAALTPSAAIEVALAITGLYPNLTPAVAAAVASVVPAMASTLALELIRENPLSTASVVSAVVAVVPDSALLIVGVAARELPNQASTVAAVIVAVVPNLGDTVSETIQNLLLSGGRNTRPSAPITPPAPENSSKNPAILNPLPPPRPTPTPTPTPVSPSA